MNIQPAFFISHGGPTFVVADIPARHFLAGLGDSLKRPDAIVTVSAHWETDAPRATSSRQPETIHDFYGFPEEFYRLRYPAPGAPDLAARTTCPNLGRFPCAKADSPVF